MLRDSLGDRMKEYENVNRTYLTRRLPLIVRVDGVHFHSYTKGFDRPFYASFRAAMEDTMIEMCKNIMGCKLGYTQSDEITLLITDDDTIETQAWFDKNLQKIVSVSASMATYFFNKIVREIVEFDKIETPLGKAFANRTAMFDARAFLVPREEVLNVFEWRQQDCTRNAIEAAGQTYFSHGELHGKSCNEIQEMLFELEDINFNDYPTKYKRGVCARKYPVQLITDHGPIVREKWAIDYEIPIFHKQPEYINNLVYHKENKE